MTNAPKRVVKKVTRIKPGDRFHRLVVLSETTPAVSSAGSVNYRWKCKCDCGTELSVHAGSLTSGNTKSCGCFRREECKKRQTTHGMTGKSEYFIWRTMRDRCRNTKSKAWPYYGGRGIMVCERWLKFENFLEDMGMRPNHATLDRIDNSGNYEPSNCRWTTRVTQARNTRKNRMIEALGMTMCLSEWSEKTGLNPDTITARIDRHGWTPEKAVTHPAQIRSIKAHPAKYPYRRVEDSPE